MGSKIIVQLSPAKELDTPKAIVEAAIEQGMSNQQL